MIYTISAIIKPTKNNKAVMKKRGLFSNDHWLIFDVYEAMFQGNSITIDADLFDYVLEELTKIGIKY